jgi:hypothetical protein
VNRFSRCPERFLFIRQTCNNPNCQCDFDAYCSSGDNGAIRGDGDGNAGVTVRVIFMRVVGIH